MDESIQVLLSIYLNRLDLQLAYPEVKKGKLDNLIKWARIHGITIDSAKDYLTPYVAKFPKETSQDEVRDFIESIRELKDDGERICPLFTNDLYYAHLSIYKFATSFCHKKDVLDVGCGMGYGSAYLARHANSVVGIDNSHSSIWFAKLNFKSNNLRYIQMDAQNISGLDKFDLVFTSNCLEHLPNVRAFLDTPLLRSVGKMIIAVPPIFDNAGLEENLKNRYHVTNWHLSKWVNILNDYFATVSTYRHWLKNPKLNEKFGNANLKDDDFIFPQGPLCQPTITSIFVCSNPLDT